MVEFGKNFEQQKESLTPTREEMMIKLEQDRRTAVELDAEADKGNIFMIPDGVYDERPRITMEPALAGRREVVNFPSAMVQSTLEKVSVENPGLGIQIMNASMRAGQME